MSGASTLSRSTSRAAEFLVQCVGQQQRQQQLGNRRDHEDADGVEHRVPELVVHEQFGVVLEPDERLVAGQLPVVQRDPGGEDQREDAEDREQDEIRRDEEVGAARRSSQESSRRPPGGRACRRGPGGTVRVQAPASTLRLIVNLSWKERPGAPAAQKDRPLGEKGPVRRGQGDQPAAFTPSSTKRVQASSRLTEPWSAPTRTSSTAAFTWACFSPKNTGASCATEAAKIGPLGASLK